MDDIPPGSVTPILDSEIPNSDFAIVMEYSKSVRERQQVKAGKTNVIRSRSSDIRGDGDDDAIVTPGGRRLSQVSHYPIRTEYSQLRRGSVLERGMLKSSHHLLQLQQCQLGHLVPLQCRPVIETTAGEVYFAPSQT